MNVFNVVASSVISCHTRSSSLVRHISLNSRHRHSPRGLVGSSANPDVKTTFACLFLLSFVFDAAWSNDSPYFVFCVSHICFSLSMISHLPFSPFFISFVDLFFWWQQVGIDQGDIPDLSQVSVHLTFHFLFLFLRLFLLAFLLGKGKKRGGEECLRHSKYLNFILCLINFILIIYGHWGKLV